MTRSGAPEIPCVRPAFGYPRRMDSQTPTKPLWRPWNPFVELAHQDRCRAAEASPDPAEAELQEACE